MLESASAADYIPNMTSLARQGYDLVIGVGFAQGDAVGKVAKQLPEDEASRSSTSTRRPCRASRRTSQGLLFREQEVGYLAGYLAGADGEARAGHGRDQRRRRHEGAAGRPLHRRLPGGREEGRAGDQDC